MSDIELLVRFRTIIRERGSTGEVVSSFMFYLESYINYLSVMTLHIFDFDSLLQIS